MKKITLWGYYGFGNVGDEALLSSVLSLVKNQSVIIPCGPSPSVAPSAKLQLVGRSPKSVFSAIKNSDGFVLGPGGLIHERRKPQATYYHLFGPLLSKYMKKPYCAVGQQFGPFKRSLTKRLAVSSLAKADFLTVRDSTSFETAKAMGLNPTLSADLAFLIEPDEPSKPIKDKIMQMPTPRTVFVPGIDPALTPTPEKSAQIIRKMLEKTGGSAILLPFFPGRDDEYIADVAKLLDGKNTLTLTSPISWRDAFGMFTMCQYALPMRLHAVIAASLVCLPALPIPYYSKVPMIAKELDYNIMISHDDTNWEEKLDRFLEQSQTICTSATLKVREMKKRAAISARMLDEFLAKH